MSNITIVALGFLKIIINFLPVIIMGCVMALILSYQEK